jgi:PhnB protein
LYSAGSPAHPHGLEDHDMAVKPIPDGYHSITPYLIVSGAAQALEFYKEAFGAVELFRMPTPDGRVGHAEIRVGDSVVMLADEHPEIGARSPRTVGGTTVHLLLYVSDADATYTRAVEAGAKAVRPLKNQFYGDRSGTVEDPFGHSWTVATHVEDLSPEEMDRRHQAELAAAGAS